MELSEIFMNIGGTAFSIFIVYLMNRVYTILNQLKG